MPSSCSCGFAVINNNHSFHQTSRAEFNAQLDHAIDSSTNWIVQQPDIQGNPPLMFMVGDMAEMSGDPRLKNFIAAYLASPRVRVPGHPVTWYYAHWADASVPVPTLSAAYVDSLSWQDKWFTYATAPDRVALTADEQANMFSPTMYSWGSGCICNSSRWITSVIINGPSPRLDAAIIPVTQGVATTRIGISA